MGCAVPNKIITTLEFNDLSQYDEESLDPINDSIFIKKMPPHPENLKHYPKLLELTNTSLKSTSLPKKSCLKTKPKTCLKIPKEKKKFVRFNNTFKIIIGDRVHRVRRTKRQPH